MVKVKKLNHSSILIEDKDIIIYIDPFKINETKKADYIIISHDHHDHLSLGDIKKILKKETKILLPQSCAPKVLELKDNEIITFALNEKINFDKFNLEIIPAYNTDKPYHTQEKDWAGFIITINKKRIYYAGDTDLIPEMNLLGDIDLAILPISGVYVMDAEEAANATIIIQPEYAIPVHYGSIVGSPDDVEVFKRKAHCDVVIDEIEL